LEPLDIIYCYSLSYCNISHMMKKLLGIMVLGLLLSGNAYAKKIITLPHVNQTKMELLKSQEHLILLKLKMMFG
jgi:hypothetical protein